MDSTDTSRELTKPDYTALEFPPPPAERPYVIINMVSSADGKAVIEGNERGLGSPTDRRLLRELRVHADVVLNGSGTLRASGTSARLGDLVLEEIRVRRAKTRLPVAAVLTGSADLPFESTFFTARDFEAVVYTSAHHTTEHFTAIAATGRSVVTVPAGEEVPAMLHHMRDELGARLLLLEGGPTLNGDFFRRGLVDEFFLTIGAVIVGGDHVASPVEMPEVQPNLETVQRLDLLSAVPNPATSEIYLRYRVRR